MKRILLIFIGLLALHSPAFANRDSLGVKQVNNKWFIMHKVEKGTGIYSIAKHYNVNVEDVTNNNPGTDKGIRAGQVLLIPFDKPASTSNQLQDVSAPTGKVAHYYTVDTLPTLYRISLKYKVSVEQLRKWNNLSDDHISKGQKLIIGYTVGAGEKIVQEKKPITVTKTPVAKIQEPKQKTFAQTASLTKGSENTREIIKTSTSANANGVKTEIKEIQEAVLATTIDDNNMSSAKNLALHRTATPGTVIRITNPMNNTSVYVKVIGPLTSDEEDTKLVMKISKSTADKLGIKDEFFRLNTYYSAEVTKK